MKAFRTTFEAEIDVRFLEPEKSLTYFCSDGEWRDCFYKLDDLQDLAENIACAFQEEDSRWDSLNKRFHVFLEGYGDFVKQEDDGPMNGWYMNTEESWDGGRIAICTESDLYPAFTDEREKTND